MSRPRIHWLWYALGWIGAICVAGAMLGALLFPVFGRLFDSSLGVRELALNGVRILGFYFAIWAPGVAIVLTVKREYEARQPSAKSENPAAR